MEELQTIAEKIAETASIIGAIEVNPNKPWTWNSGTKNPIYNDNRMLLGQHRHRMQVAEGIIAVMEKNNIVPDFLCATSLSGIAPACSVQLMLGEKGTSVPLLIVQEGEIYGLYLKKFACSDTSAVVATAPWAIPMGIQAANNAHCSFMYLRPERKTHGKQKIVEGNLSGKSKKG